MKYKIKNLIKNSLFIPQYFNFKKNTNKIKPFFGYVGFETSGRQKRIQRLTSYFGNYFFNPNVLYVGSQWGKLNHGSAIKYKIKRNIPIILNQNGIYYPGWFKGDYKKHNDDLININNFSDDVIYQSEFCRSSLEELTGKKLKKGIILHNCAPIKNNLEKTEIKKNNADLNCFLGGVFNSDADHILFPALNAIEILNSKQTSTKYFLKIAGIFTKSAKDQSWFKKLISKIDKLSKQNVCKYIGPYNNNTFSSILSDVDIALHLKYKDPCPNAVVEKMNLGIPHIYSDSGGTPELIGNSGIPLYVKDSWEKQHSVSSEQLVNSIIYMSDNLEKFKQLTVKESLIKFNWENYLLVHRKIFRKFVLAK